LAQVEAYIARLKRLGTPISSEVAPMSFADLPTLYDAQVAHGHHYALQTRWLADLTPEIIPPSLSPALRGHRRFRSWPCTIFMVWERRSSRMRRRLQCVEITSCLRSSQHGEPGAEGDIHRQWMGDLSKTLAPLALPGGYANFLTSDAHDQIGAAWC
jgi:hypothetical protein